MKPHDDIPNVYKGKDAYTAREIATEKGISQSTVRIYADKMIALGKWKVVKVKRGNHYPEAYIKVK